MNKTEISEDIMRQVAKGDLAVSVLSEVLALLRKEGTKITAEQLWTYSPNYWKNRMWNAKTEDEMLEVAGQFSGIALEAFCAGADTFTKGQKEYGILIKLMDRHAGWMVTSSNHIQDGFRLTRYWFRTILVQMSMAGATSDNDVERIKERVVEMFTGLGWLDSVEECLNPMYDTLRTIFPVKYMKTETEVGKINIILEPCTEFPICSVWETKKGTQFEVNAISTTEKGLSIVMQDMEPPYKLLPYSEEMVRGWKRLI